MTIPNNVTTINAFAFSGNKLTSVTLPNNLTTIEPNTFADNLLTSVTIPAAVTSIGERAYDFNPGLTAAKFLGAAPTVTAGSLWNESFDTASGSLVLSYPLSFGAPGTPGGYTTPTWSGYTTTPYAAATIVGAATAATVVGTPFSYTPQVGGTPAPVVTLTSGTLPAGLDLNATTGEISGTATATGIFPITLTATNGVGSPATSSVTISVRKPPSITGAATATGTVGESFAYSPDVDGYPAPAVTLTSGTLPAGLELSSTTGKITGTPTATGSFPITLTATNVVTTDTLDVTITVNQGPSLTGPATAAGETGQAFSYTPVVSGSPAPTVSYVGALPNGLVLNSSTGTITGVPTSFGSFLLTLSAANGVGTAAQLDVTITISPEPLNGLAPTITGSAREGQTLTAQEGPVTPASTTFAYQWKRYGSPIAGATSKTYKLRASDVGRKLSITITATAPGQAPQTLTSPLTGFVSSPNKRLILNTSTVKKGQSFNLIATGLKPKQTYIIWLSGKRSYIGFTDANGMVAKSVKFPTSTKAGTRRVRVSGYTNGTRTFTVYTHVNYTK